MMNLPIKSKLLPSLFLSLLCIPPSCVNAMDPTEDGMDKLSPQRTIKLSLTCPTPKYKPNFSDFRKNHIQVFLNGCLIAKKVTAFQSALKYNDIKYETETGKYKCITDSSKKPSKENLATRNLRKVDLPPIPFLAPGDELDLTVKYILGPLGHAGEYYQNDLKLRYAGPKVITCETESIWIMLDSFEFRRANVRLFPDDSCMKSEESKKKMCEPSSV